MFAPAALRHIDLLFALLGRLMARLWPMAMRGSFAPPAPVRASLMRCVAALAHGVRATLRKEGIAFPDLDDAALLRWFNAARPLAGASRATQAPRSPFGTRFGGLRAGAGRAIIFFAEPCLTPGPRAFSGPNARAPPSPRTRRCCRTALGQAQARPLALVWIVLRRRLAPFQIGLQRGGQPRGLVVRRFGRG